MVDILDKNYNTPSMDQLVFRDALLFLIAENNYDEISIQQICAQAGKDTSAFYNTFNNKHEISWLIFKQALSNAAEGIVYVKDKGQLSFSALDFYRNAEENKRLYRLLVQSTAILMIEDDGHNYLFQSIRKRIMDQIPESVNFALQISALSYTVAGTFLDALIWWLERGMPFSAEVMDELTRNIILPGANLVLQLSQRQARFSDKAQKKSF